MESVLSQKQFIIKKQTRVAKRGNSKGAGLMKAYFPKLIKNSAGGGGGGGAAGNNGVEATTPTNLQYQQMGGGMSGSGSARHRKYGQVSRS